jgi:hypothetical protein
VLHFYFTNPQHPVPGKHVNVPLRAGHVHDAAGHPADIVRRCVDGARAPDHDPPSVEVRERSRIRLIQSADERGDPFGRRRPVDLAVGRQPRAPEGRPFCGLSDAPVAVEKTGDGLAEMLPLQPVQAVVEIADRVFAIDGNVTLKEHIPGVETVIDDVNRDCRKGFAVDDRPVHVGASTVTRQRRVVHVDKRAAVNQIARQDPIKRRDDHAVGAQASDQVAKRPDRGVAEHRNSELLRVRDDGVGRGSVGIDPAHHAHDLAALRERLQRALRRRPHADEENATHRQGPSAAGNCEPHRAQCLS